MRCPFCRDFHPDNARFCPRTGQAIQHTLEPNKRGANIVLPLAISGLFVIALGIILSIRDYQPLGVSTVSAVEITKTDPPNGNGEYNEVDTPAGVIADDTAPPPTTSTSSVPPTWTSVKTLTPTFPSTDTPVPTETPAPTATETSILAIIKTNQKDQAEMVYIPNGEFLMGSDSENDPYFWGAETPSHKVQLNAFWIYVHEVTNAMYQACAAQKACPIPEKNTSRTRKSYYNNPEYANYPVIFVDWTSAQSYCVWAGGGLPTEAQWEKAARGTDERLFPWTDQYTNIQANLCDTNCSNSQRERDFDDSYRDTSPVGSFPAGVSPYGALDMAGNVWEWVHDWFQEGYYQISPLENPPGPASSRYRGIRGGSFDNPLGGVRTVARYAVRPDIALDTVGFRCAMKDQ